MCGNRGREIAGPLLDSTDAGNLTPTGTEGNGVVASPGCEDPATVYADPGAGPDGAALDLSLAESSPALDSGTDPLALGLDPALEPALRADFRSESARPRDGDRDGTPAFDMGALEADFLPPVVTIESPLDGAVFTDSPIHVVGTVADESPIVALSIDGLALPAGPSFAAAIDLVVGANGVAVTATDAAGNVGSASLTVTLDPSGPLAVSIESPRDGSATSEPTVVVSGTVSNEHATVEVNGVPAAVGGTTYSTLVSLATGANLIRAVAARAADVAVAEVIVVRDGAATPPPPPDPSTTAPAVDATVATSFAQATAFLYSGPDAVQTGVEPETIDPLRAGVIRGRALTRGGDPLPSAAVSVVGRAELGGTLTRADGQFDLVVNGGGALTLRFEREGYVGIFRTVEVPWREFAVLDDLVMVPRDPRATVVDLSSPAPVQVVEGATVTDALGTRQPTLLFTAGTSASATLADGSSQPLSTLSLHVTELSVGASALAAAPATIPPGADPTFLFEISAEEAEAAGATGVQLTPPVPFYLENTIGLAVGDPAPLASFDERLLAWVDRPLGVRRDRFRCNQQVSAGADYHLDHGCRSKAGPK